MLVVPSFFKGVTINAKMRLDHELLSSPEPLILKWLGYRAPISLKYEHQNGPKITQARGISEWNSGLFRADTT
ncbi:hypothetical protein CJF42_06015 [Pseudoalteromonas sp. NBT06-2]|uniref:hypothetical protein n=1 Tax=Pseudoalteromonas sp. NBT06-2 TaxID=2025950 RepID=UPI000BA7CD91|nr:hypothetical protein [Pseudoalteromonas sp. NBT06-2]PAJ75204.1 hypothetical protein CJF42_06015 [Pseudoalteromonas sp. NBT06-2]